MRARRAASAGLTVTARRGRAGPHGGAGDRLQRAGHPAAAGRQGVHLPRGGRDADHRRRGDRPHQVAGHPAGVGGRVDLLGPERPHPGHRPRRQGAPPVPLPRRVAGGAGPREARPHPRASPAASRRCASRWRTDIALDGMPQRAGAGLRGAAARARLLPHRRRGVRRGERHLRPRHHPQAPRARARRAPRVRLRRQERPAPAVPGGRRRGARRHHHAAAPPGARPMPSCSPTRTGASGWT